MGTPEVGGMIRAMLSALPRSDRELELIVVTHIDSDHIGGVLTCVVNEGPPEGVTVRDVWFNGLAHLAQQTRDPRERFSVAQGNQLVTWLRSQRWNEAFGRGRICRDAIPPVVELRGGLRIFVLGPRADRLQALADAWWLDELERAMEPSADTFAARTTTDRVTSQTALRSLSARATGGDTSASNGTSIALLIEYGGRRILLAGDAHASDLIEGLRALDKLPVRLDAFKMPHHGSRENTTVDLMRAVDCPLFIFSTDGTQFGHPDPEAVACVVEHGRRRRRFVTLGFNSTRVTGWWDNPTSRARFRYRILRDDGLTIPFSCTRGRPLRPAAAELARNTPQRIQVPPRRHSVVRDYLRLGWLRMSPALERGDWEEVTNGWREARDGILGNEVLVTLEMLTADPQRQGEHGRNLCALAGMALAAQLATKNFDFGDSIAADLHAWIPLVREAGEDVDTFVAGVVEYGRLRDSAR